MAIRHGSFRLLKTTRCRASRHIQQARLAQTRLRCPLVRQPQYGGRGGLMRGVTETVAWFGESSHMVAYKADISNI
jgi:NAD-dependent SIR2 family protein deacetylase